MGINNQTVMAPISSFPDSLSGQDGAPFPGSYRGGCQGFRGPAPSTLLDECSANNNSMS